MICAIVKSAYLRRLAEINIDIHLNKIIFGGLFCHHIPSVLLRFFLYYALFSMIPRGANVLGEVEIVILSKGHCVVKNKVVWFYVNGSFLFLFSNKHIFKSSSVKLSIVMLD